MSDEKIDVLAVMEGLCEVADEHQDEGPSGYGWASDKLCKLRAEGPEARAAVAELIEAAGDYFTGWCHDEADEYENGIGPVCSPEQHKAAVRLYDALARVRSS